MSSEHAFVFRGLDANFNSPVYFQINFVGWAVKFETTDQNQAMEYPFGEDYQTQDVLMLTAAIDTG